MMKNELLKTIYENDFEVLTDLVNDWDPIGLIVLGAPRDEYSCLVEKILSKLYEAKTKEEIVMFCTDYMRSHFGFSIHDVPEQYREKVKAQTESSIIRIVDWYLNRSFKNCRVELSKFIINKEIKELQFKIESEMLTLLESETGSYNDVELEVTKGNNLRVWEIGRYGGDKLLVYDYENLLWGVSKNGLIEAFFDSLHDAMYFRC